MQTNDLHPGNGINNQTPTSPNKRSTFALRQRLCTTSRFAEIGVSRILDTVPGDSFQVSLNCKDETLSLKAPFLDSFNHKHDAFHVPYSAILPRTWQQFITQPNIGDDIPTAAGPGTNKIASIPYKYVSDVLSSLKGYGEAGTLTDEYSFKCALKLIFILSHFYSHGSLLNDLGLNIVSCFYGIDEAAPNQPKNGKDADDLIDSLCSIIASNVVSVKDTNSGITYFVKDARAELEHNFRDLLESWLCGDIPVNGLGSVTLVGSADDLSNAICKALWPASDYETGTASSFGDLAWLYASVSVKFNLARAFAYQIACAHYYSNDSVDYVYTADLYRQNLKAVATTYSLLSGSSVYNWNGVNREYEPCSAFVFENLFSPVYWDAFYAYTGLVFARRSSLRFVDFFTGLRTRPLAIGNTDIPVSAAQTVDVIDVTRSIQMQRFLNAVNRSGRKIANYIKTLFGVVPEKDICDPSFLFHTENTCFGSDVENTGSDQLTEPQSRTSRVSGLARYQFTCGFDSYGIFILLHYYDVPRKYGLATDPACHVTDRFELFNPFLENTGDQAVLVEDVSSVFLLGALKGQPYGYQQRYMEYKQNFDRATGGFVRKLPGFAMVAADSLELGLSVNPESIRSHHRELDDFFVGGMPNYSLGSYFHFINVFDVDVVASREMSYDAKIL